MDYKECYCCKQLFDSTPVKNNGYKVRKRQIEKHHIIPEKYDNIKTNKTVWLCIKCHKKVHKMISETAIKTAYLNDKMFFNNVLNNISNGRMD